MEETIVVVGSTGLQGRAVTARLLAEGWRVRAVTRTPAKAPEGAEAVAGDMADAASLVKAAEGAYGLFSVQPTVGSPDTGPNFTAADEVRLGRNVAAAARAAGIRHFVFSSVCGADRHERLPENVLSKQRIERHITELRLPATILRPVSFMENFTGAYALHDGAVSTGMAPDVPQQLVAVDDVATVAALTFANPTTWIDTQLDLAGDELTPTRIAAAISTETDRELPYRQIPIETIRAVNEDFAYANEWLNDLGWRADMKALKTVHPNAMDFTTWLSTTGADQIRTFLAGQS